MHSSIRTAVLVALLGVVAGGCSGPMQHKALITREVEEAFNAGNLAVIDEIMAEDMVNHDPPPGIAGDREGFKELVRMHRTAFSDFHCKTEGMVAEGDMVASRWSWTGVHDKGPYMGVPPTGKKVTVTGMTLNRFEEGKIVEQWHEVDIMGMLEQMGVLSDAPPAAPPKPAGH